VACLDLSLVDEDHLRGAHVSARNPLLDLGPRLARARGTGERQTALPGRDVKRPRIHATSKVSRAIRGIRPRA
jgi:hypothetical protein